MARYNRNFAKVNESGELEFAPLPLVINGDNVWTNIPEAYIENGYYPIERTKAPEKEGFYYTDFWAFENNKCVQKWEEHEIPEEPEIEDDVAEYAEAAKILLGESE